MSVDCLNTKPCILLAGNLGDKLFLLFIEPASEMGDTPTDGHHFVLNQGSPTFRSMAELCFLEVSLLRTQKTEALVPDSSSVHFGTPVWGHEIFDPKIGLLFFFHSAAFFTANF